MSTTDENVLVNAWEEYENEKKGINTMVNTTNLNMGVVMNQINPEVIRVSTEYYILLILNNKIKTSDDPERVKQYYITTKYSVNWHLKSFYTLEFR